MKYLIAIIVFVLVSWLAIFMLRNARVYWFMAIPLMMLAGGVYMNYFRKRTNFSFGLFSGSLVAVLFLGLILLLFAMYPPFQ